MLNFLGMTRHLSTTAGYAKRIGWILLEDVTQSPFPLTGVSFTGVVKTEQGDLPVVIEHGEQEHCLELTFPALPVGRWPYAIHAQDESGEDLRLFSGYIGAVDSVAPVESSTVYDIPAMGITIPVEASKTIKAQWLSNTASIIAAQQAQQNANTSSTNAETASQAAKTATDAAATAAARAEEAEGYAGAAWASKNAAADSATAASTSATNAARDANFLNTDAITASGSSTVTKTVPYHLAGIKVPKGTHSTIQARFEVSNPQWNYSSFAGFSFLWRATNAAKLSFGIGRGGKTIRPDLSIDSYSIIPANGLAYNHGEILDITFDNVRNTDRNGYTVRVREIFALNNTDSWQVKTTTSFVPASQNEPVPWTIAKIIYQQKSVASIARYEDTGALWLMLTGGQGNNLYQIATCRGVSNFETGVGVSQWVTDVVNNAAGDVSVYAGTGEYTYYHPGNVNPVFYGLDAISRNCIETEETADFVDINIPL